MLVVGMIPYNLVMSLDSGENSPSTPYEHCALNYHVLVAA